MDTSRNRPWHFIQCPTITTGLPKLYWNTLDRHALWAIDVKLLSNDKQPFQEILARDSMTKLHKYVTDKKPTQRFYMRLIAFFTIDKLEPYSWV